MELNEFVRNLNLNPLIIQSDCDDDTYYKNHEDRYRDVEPYETKMPEMIKKFLLYFRNAVNEGMMYEMQNLYENTLVYFVLN